jgi:hypothetical protein
MARKPANKTIEQTDVDNEALQQGSAALVQASSNALKVAEMIGYDLPYDRERIVQEARFYMSQSAEAMLEAGKRLILLKENEPHGEYENALQRLGIGYDVANQMRKAVLKYLNPALTSKVDTYRLLDLGKSKLFELMTVSDDDLAELVDGGTVAGLKLDDIDRMTARELKAALRETRETQEATEKVLAAKNKKLDQLASELERKKSATPADEWEWAPARRALLDSCETIANYAQSELRRALGDIHEQAASSGVDVPEEMEVLLGQAMTSTMHALIALQKEFRINVDLEAEIAPPWMKDFQTGKGKN